MLSFLSEAEQVASKHQFRQAKYSIGLSCSEGWLCHKLRSTIVKEDS